MESILNSISFNQIIYITLKNKNNLSRSCFAEIGGFASLYIWGIGGERKAALKKDNFAGLSDLWVKRIFTSCVFNILKLYKT